MSVKALNIFFMFMKKMICQSPFIVHRNERHDSIKYIPACTHRPMSCGATCNIDVPMVFMPTNP